MPKYTVRGNEIKAYDYTIEIFADSEEEALDEFQSIYMEEGREGIVRNGGSVVVNPDGSYGPEVWIKEEDEVRVPAL